MNIIQPNWPAPASIVALTTTKPYWGTNYKEAGEKEKLKTLLALPNQPFWLNQIHGNQAVAVNYQETEEVAADASFTHSLNHVCSILTADCLPVLICNKAGNLAAGIHAGWRGLATGIIENTLQQLPEQPENLLVWLGPAIGPEKFEVGADVYQAFTAKQPQAAGCFKPFRAEKWLADLYALAKLRLHSLGVEHIYGGEFCTYSDQTLFFSYRRDQGRAGSMASLIWIR